MSLPTLPPHVNDLIAWAMGALRSEISHAVHEAVAGELPGAIRTATRPEYQTRVEAASYLGRSLRSLDHLRKSKRLAWTKRGGRVMVKTDDLDAFLDEGRVPARAVTL